MAAADSTRPDPTDWVELLGRFSDGLSLIAITYRSLVMRQIATQEQAGLEAAVCCLESVYNDLDRAFIRLAKAAQ
jgi:hypothetical protein